ncbi:MobF family relaxase [Microbacterium rhizosphaerae]|uniref:MobF family relaxase n=2 Tax=Microbacterium rhizosphaerae TaxID=1678237 RepID=A0ABZ0SQ34_9MICO|nr:MobF family relaxase [Microbacterium rhizosphaerae]WPR91439.1 MobF family relaxase [Microbacterium rhizosphaerae]
MRVMSAGDGYKYLLRTVVAGDGARSLSTPLTRYYNEEGTPPGRWIGSGVSSLSSSLHVGDIVTESQLQLLIGMGRHPLSGEPLGRAYPHYGSDPKDEGAASRQRAVAGYDFTFSIPKSASVLWGIADARVQEIIVGAHHRAVAHVVAYMEREVAATRTGATAGDGAVAQVAVTGLIATAFDHFDSRAGDPHLHTHVVVSNKVQTALDGKWRSLDGRPLHAAVVALSELHEAIFTDELTRALGVSWEPRERGRDRNPAWAITGIPDVLVAHFSTRSHAINDETDRLIAAFMGSHGHRPSPATVMKLRAQATLATRPEKQVHSLGELTAGWRQRASVLLGQDATTWARALTARHGSRIPPLRAADLSPALIARLGGTVVAAVAEKRSTWRHWNLVAEAARQTMPMRFASASDRETAVELFAQAAEKASLRLSPPEIAESPSEFQRPDGSSVFRARRSAVFTASMLLEAESRLIARSRDTSAPRLTMPPQPRRQGGNTLSLDQAVALEKIAASGRTVDALVGAAGTGKTSAMRALRDAWESTYGRGSVVGLAPSAGAAHVLAEDLGIPTENTAKWWTTHLTRGVSFAARQLVIIDEASLAGTLSLDRVSSVAAEAGAKVLLVGDHAQLQAVDAGGAFALLAHDRDDVPELVDVHRFLQSWEKNASVRLRDGDTDVIEEYANHGRVVEGESDAMIDAAYRAWRRDVGAGRASILVADSNEAVTALNVRARAERLLDGDVAGAIEVSLHEGTAAAVGDIILTRRNDRTLRAGRSWVRNGDRWTVLNVLKDGGMLVRRADRRGSAAVMLPAGYVAEHVDLGYAITAHRAQGITTDTAHVLVHSGMTRESLYVAMTRGRVANTAYVAVDRPEDTHSRPHPGEPRGATAATVLHGVLQHVGAELSAHETMAAEQDRWGSIAQLAAEYETIAAAAQHDRWVSLIQRSGLTTAEAARVVASDAFGPLTAALRRAEACHHDVELLFRALVRTRSLDDAVDIAAVLESRLDKALARGTTPHGGRGAPRLIVGLIPESLGPMTSEMQRTLDERRVLMERRAQRLVEQAMGNGDTWISALGAVPERPASAAWRRQARVVAAYRDRYAVSGRSALGSAPTTTAQERDATQARAALDAARRLARNDRDEARWTRRSARELAVPGR